MLGVRLDNILIDGTKLHVNLPSFSRRGFPGGDHGLKAWKTEVVHSHSKWKKGETLTLMWLL